MSDRSSASSLLHGVLILFLTIAFANSAHAASFKPGDPAPVVPATDMAGVSYNVDAKAMNKVILLDFWSIYCVSCVAEMPMLARLYDKYKDKGLINFGIDLDSFSPKRVQKFIDGLDFKIPYPIVIDGKRDIANAFGVNMLPTTIIIDRQGKIQMFHIGYKQPDDDKVIEEALQKVLK